MIDLHSHSTHSDGTLTPSELLILAKEKGIEYFAITDHDDIEGSKKLIESKHDGITVYSGVELNAKVDKGQMHILGYNIDLYNEELNKRLKELKENVAVTNQGNIAFQKIIFTTHFPIDNKHGMYFMKMYQHRSYVIACEQGVNVEGMYVDEAMNGMSFRNYGDLLLVGGGDHRTGKQGGGWREIEETSRKYYGELKEAARWATQDCITLDEVPYIGEYSKRMPGCYVATGFNKWGMTSSMVAGKMLTDLICGRENVYQRLYDPARSMLRPQLVVNGAEAVMNLVLPAKKRCPHMGCGLKWNKEEHSWDCPCHGSRFDENGGVIEGPAMGDLR